MGTAQHNPDSEPRNARQETTPGSLTVLLNYPLEAELVHRIEAVDSRVRVVRALPPPGRGDPKPIEGDALDAALAQAEVIFGWRVPVDWVQKAPRLRWVQLSSAGAEMILSEGLLVMRPDLLLTTASGVHEVPISEHIVAMILYFARDFNMAIRDQREHRWNRYTPGEAYGKTVCLVGYGAIGHATADLCKALGMRVLCIRGSVSEQQPGEGPVERFYPFDDLNGVLAESDYLVLAAPRTPRTEGMIDREQFEVMKQGAVLVNISRGALVDETALIGALREGKLAGAGLDVFAQEPLPGDSALWDMPNVLITPHISGANPHYNERVTALFCDNIARFLNGEPLRNVVNAERGY